MFKRFLASTLISFIFMGISSAHACKTGYVEYNGSCYKQLACKNGGKQQGNVCKCTAGWEGNLCQTAKTCTGYNHTKCYTGYIVAGTCMSGNNKYVKCKTNPCTGYDYAECPTGYAQSDYCMSAKNKKLKCENCASGYVKYQGKCYKKLACKNGGKQQGNKCKCTAGWTGKLCQTAKTCTGYNYTKCYTGYVVASTCMSGNNKYVKCKTNPCTGYDYTECPTGYVQSDYCMSAKNKKLKCENCASGYVKYQGKCYKKLACKNGGKQQGNKCKCSAAWTGKLCQTAASCDYTTTSCKNGYIETGNTCQSGNNTYVECAANPCKGYYETCPQDYKATTDTCLSGDVVKYKCKSELTNVDKGSPIVKKTLTEKNGVVTWTYDDGEQDITMVNNQNLKVITRSESTVTGVLSTQDEVANAYADSGTKNVAISIEQRGNGMVYGMRAKRGADVGDGLDVDNVLSAGNAKVASAIKINNLGSGNVFGMYAGGGTPQTGKDAAYISNVWADIASEGTGTINISNKGNGNAYGMFASTGISYTDVSNAQADENAEAAGFININNYGKGNVFGIKSGDRATNSSVYGEDGNGNAAALGSININHSGSKKAYGLYANDTAQNASNSGGKEALGHIRINNKKNGSAYGISGKNVSNAEGENNSQGEEYAEGVIEIINNGKGNTYGMYSNVADNRIRNTSSGYVSSYIDMANRGNGLAVGIYSKNGRVDNSGNITIHNLGDGTAVGIYADGSTEAFNSGTILIDRDNYTDSMGTESETDDVTYTAKSAKGGKAIGIYGASGSSITNTGTIAINGADKAYGIYSEGSNVINNGTVLIDGEYTENAIRLNGGQLLQNGVLKVDADWENAGGVSCVHGYISEGQCLCDEYWTGNSCDVPVACPDGMSTSANCGIGYRTVEEYGYYSGDNSCYSCVALTCPDGTTTNPSCYNGFHQEKTGYYSGDDACYRCAKDECPAGSSTSDSCGSGSYAVATGDYSGYDACYRCESETCPAGYTKGETPNDGNYDTIVTEHGSNCYKAKPDNCPSGYTKGATPSPASGYNTATTEFGSNCYQAKDCAGLGYVTSCSGDQYATDDICYSGNVKMYKCAQETCEGNLSGGSCPEGYRATVACVDHNGNNRYQCSECADGYHKEGEACVKDSSCVHGTQSGNTCACNRGWHGVNCDQADTCAGYDYENACPNGYEVIDSCPSGDVVKYICQESTSGDEPLIGKNGNTNNSSIKLTNNQQREVYGLVGNDDSNVNNAYSNMAVTKTGVINITNNEGGPVYGVNGSSDANNAMASKGTARGYITIENNSDADVYGINSSSGKVANAFINTEGNAEGYLTIRNSGEGKVYGLYAGDQYNFSANAWDGGSKSDNNLYVKGVIDISNTGNNAVYGMYGGYLANTYYNMNHTYSDAIAEAKILLDNQGNGDAYGMHGDYLHNAYKGTGLIYVNNNGTGNAYGMYAHGMHYGTVFNARDNGIGTINLINKAGGNAYGMHTEDAHNEGKNSTIEMVNIGSGLAVGMYGKDGSIENSGEVKIHNLGNGTAIGIYADGSANVTNSGNITIDRESYTDDKATDDTADDVTYTAQSTRGGKAIGIYGANGSSITNTETGTITINGADTAYGIWSEGSDVTNNGTILIDDEYTENAIRLNGGQLLQNGILKVGADWSDNGESGSDGVNSFDIKPLIGKNANTNNGTIELSNDKNRHVYGLYNNESEETTNANGEDSIISIDNSGNGNVYGVYSDYMYSNVAYNAKGAKGIVSIDNDGNGNVYGIYSRTIADDECYNGGDDYISYNSYGNGTGIIRIHNSGSGNTYGLYGVKAINGQNEDISHDTINIINQGNGNAYGAYTAGGGNYSESSSSGTIEMANIGNGLVVGMYSNDEYELTNRGDIRIHNLGNGTAIGIYANSGGNYKTVQNYGNIIIDRESYTDDKATADTSDDVTYTAQSTRGGKAIGIYGTSGSNIINYSTGTITINGAENAYGIYSEGGDVANHGTILIDGEYTENAIHINGGQLMQDGVLKVGTDWNNVGGTSAAVCAHGHSSSGACYCDDGWYGSNCDKPVSSCIHGYISDYDCICYEYWTGDSCDIPVACPDGMSTSANCGRGYHAVEEYERSGDNSCYSCVATDCPNDTTTNPSCYNGFHQEQTGDYSGDEACYRCAKDECPAGSSTSDDCGSGSYAVATGDYSGYDACYRCESETCPAGYTKGETPNDGNYDTIVTEYGSNCYKAKPDDCPTGYIKGATPSDGNYYTAITEFGSNCYKAKDDTCPTGYIKGATPSEGNYDTVTTEFGSNCYKAKEESCPVGSSTSTECGEGYEAQATGKYAGGEACYKCVAYNCAANGFETVCQEGYHALETTCLSGTTVMYKCEKNPCTGFDYTECPDGLAVVASCKSGNVTKYKCGDNGGELVGTTEFNNNAEIVINNTEERDVYGMKGDGGTDNAYSSSDVNAGIIINNQSNHDVYGIATVDDCCGVGNANAFTDTDVNGIISINNVGNGNVYGMYGDTAVNVNVGGKGTNALGIIRIDNNGSGDAFGIKSNSSVWNVADSSELWHPEDNRENGTAIGKINMINRGKGNAYGMHGQEVYNSNAENQTSTIEIANVGNGLAVGMYGKDGSIENSGEVKIHNLGDGTAIGIIAEGTITVTNSGNITIDRESYTDDKATDDTADDVTYTAQSTRGGKAIGIYGANGSSITNTETGTITINGADTAYGIWSEGSDVTNNGTILIDGEYIENAIRLNGGQLLQNGVLKVGADWSDNGESGANITLNCVNGYQNGNTCECYSGWSGTLCDVYENTCDGYVTSCPSGQHIVDSCFNGYTEVYACEPNGVDNGEELIGTTQNVNDTVITLNNTQDRNVYGMKPNNEQYQIVNSETSGEIHIENSGTGNVYGMYGENAYNALNNGSSHNDGLIEIVSENANNVYGIYGTQRAQNSNAGGWIDGEIHDGDIFDMSATIRINNTGGQNVYGLYSEYETYNGIGTQSTTCSGDDCINYTLKGNGLIDIVNNGDANVYGMYNAGSSYWGQNAGNHADAEIRINNTGNGNVYGMYAGSATNKTIDAVTTGKINISNTGSGKAYGIYGMNDATNASSGTGIININNEGIGKAYGLYGGNQAVNAANYGSNGLIRINNLSSGTVYGMYADNIQNSQRSNNGETHGKISVINQGTGNAYGMSGRNIQNDTAEDYKQYSTIEMVNRNDGLVVGMYGKDGSKIDNNGEIRIHNLGNGTAIGIYADGEIEADNDGIIIIDRESYTDDMGTEDTLDDVPYTAATSRGGKAIGIYGSKGSEISNDGIIRIYGAATAYGIWSEGEDVENEGIIEIDGQYTENAIRLNGGQLLQNGVVKVGADWSNGDDAYENDDDWIYTANNSSIEKTQSSSEALVGFEVTNQIGVNAYALNGNETGIISVTQTGSGDVYGMHGIVSEGQGEDENNYDDYELVNAAADGSNEATGTILVRSYGYADNSTGEVFGMYTNHEDMYITNANYDEKTATKDTRATGLIDISNNGNKNVYGIYSGEETLNAEGDERGEASGTIRIENTGNGDVYAIHAVDAANNADATEASKAYGRIDINNNGNGDVYGLYSEESFLFNSLAGHNRGLGQTKDTAYAESLINIRNNGTGSTYGMRSIADSGNNQFINNASASFNSTAIARIRIENAGNGKAYGIYGLLSYAISNAGVGGTANPSYKPHATGLVNMINTAGGNAYGMYGNRVSNCSDDNSSSTIEMANTGNGLAVGIYGKNDAIVNSGEIKIHNLGNGTAVGIYADGSANVTNSGAITINRESYTDDMGTEDTADDVTYNATTTRGGKAIGIYGAAGTRITNTETGVITISDAADAYGIYSEGGDVTNNGTIVIDGNANHAKAIWLSGAKLFQDGVVYASGGNNSEEEMSAEEDDVEDVIASNIAPRNTMADNTASSNNVTMPQSSSNSGRKPASLNLDDFGGTVVASETSQFIVEGAISGNLAINNNVIENGFDTTYSVKNMIQAADASGLHLISQSALFDATLQNGSDAVMTMKSFNDVVTNQSLAEFLKRNYAAENNEALFGLLKGKETLAALNDTLDSMVSSDMFNRFTFEDLTIMRDLNADMNNALFANNKDHLEIAGDITPWNFDGNSGSNARYALYNTAFGRKSLGLGLAFSDVRSNNGRNNRDSRYDQTFQLSTPMGYAIKGLKFIATPRFGYAYGTYDRTGFEGRTYDGTVEKRMFGLMNEARYPILLGKWSVAPAVEFNALGYHIKGKENVQEYSLNIKSQNNYSVESGVGLYANRELKPSKNSTLKLNAGVAVYHEFADPYELELGMNGMEGSFRVRDDRRKNNRAVLRTGFDYNIGDNVTVTGAFSTYVDGTTHNNANLDFKYNF